MIAGILLALHLLAAVLWVGGMAFAWMVLRPSVSVLDPPARVALHAAVFRRFFLVVWHAMVVALLTGWAMVAVVFGGFAHLPWPVNAMQALGLVMAVIFLFIFFRPWAAMRAALAAGDQPGAVTAIGRIRGLIQLNLVLGLIVVVLGALAQFR